MSDNHASPHSLVSLGEFGARARPLREELHEATLVIGLGYVGLQAVARLNGMLHAMLTHRDMHTNIRLLAIARRRSIREESILPREQRLTLDIDTISWGDVPGRYAQLGVAQWWPHSPRAREVLDDPAQIRAFGRLLLFNNAALVSESLYKLVRWLHDVGRGRDLQLTRHIYVLASLAEAEGSSMIFDVVSRLRALCGDEDTTLLGIFSLRAPDDEHDPEHVLAMANAYATLREIDSYTLLPNTFPSTLPVIGHSLLQSTRRRALDMILLTDDATADTNEPPESALAECVTNWIAASLLPPEQAPSLPGPIDHDNKSDRFYGYSTFGISKLALPTRAAMDLAAVGLAQAALNAVKTTHAATPTTSWSSQTLTSARSALLDINMAQAPDVIERLRDWNYDLSAAGLTRRLETRAARGEANRMLDLVQSEWRRLERESIGVRAIDQNATVSAVPNSIRSRMDTFLAANLRKLHSMLAASPAELAFVKGFGLVWAISALEDLEKQVLAALPEIQHVLSEAQANYQISRQSLFEIAQDYDARSGSRLGGGRKGLSAELDTRAQAGLNAAVQLIAAQARADIWQELRSMISTLREEVRDALGSVDRIAQSLREFETTCRQMMEGNAGKPPTYPAGAILTEQWYATGTQDLAKVGQLPARDLLSKVYVAWGADDVPPERRVYRFLSEIRDAARRALAGLFKFSDLYDFLNENGTQPVFEQAVKALPGASNPALIATADDKHPTPQPFEIVREVSRPFSALGTGQGIAPRSFVPSPDPDEIGMMRVLHGMMAESLPALREAYRRAYDRAGAEGTSLHIDRRWDSTMADLVHTSARREVSIIWENLIKALSNKPAALKKPLTALVRALGVALDVTDTAIATNTPPDMHLAVYKLRPFRLKLPPPSCAVLFLYSNRTAEEVGEEVFRAITPLPLEEQFAFVVNVNGRSDIDQIVEPLRRVDFTVLVLDEADVKHLIGARLPTHALSDLVLNQVNLTTISPFYTRGPVPEHMFFGREREINEVRSKLRTHSVALIGGRRIGKTSTLQRIMRLLKRHDSEYAPYYLDCHGATRYRSFFWLINRRWQVDIHQEANPVEVEDVLTALQKRHPDKSIVMLFDEVDSLLVFDRQTDNQETLFRTLRSLSNEKRCQYVFSGEKWLMRAIGNPYSALFNFAQAVRLEPLPPKVVHQLVADPFEMLNIWMEQSEQIIDRIYQISAGHPNIVQMICQAMIEELDEDPQNANLLNYEHLDRATSRRTLQEQIVQTIWGQMNPLARLITLAWPEGQRFMTLTEVEDLMRSIGIDQIPPDRLERTARDLELYCFVRPHDRDRLELIPMAFPAILDFMTDKQRQIEIVKRHYDVDPEGGTA
ncbi:MAG: AAA family ATPase [Anaerolineae bacterium]|nr:AAA family ATPase [Anaerolineae bacterium]